LQMGGLYLMGKSQDVRILRESIKCFAMKKDPFINWIQR